MTHRVPLDNVTHADLCVAIRHGAAYGDAVNQLLVMPGEFEVLQRELPILFRRGPDADGGWYAVVLTGFDRNENLFLRDDGWTTRAIPAVQQRGPFTTTAGSHGDTAPPLWIDLDDPRVGTDEGQPLFLRHGGATPYLRHVTAVLERLRHGHAEAGPIYAALADHGLFKPVRIEAEIEDGLSYRIDEIFAIDTERLAALDGPALANLNARGALRAAFMASASLANIARLIELKQASAR